MTEAALKTETAPGAMTALTLRLQDEVFAIAAENVREILDMVPVTEVPGASPFVSGLINVRGRVVPLADLRYIFDMNRPAPDEDTRIVVIELELDGDPVLTGIIADKVNSVTELEAASIERRRASACAGAASSCAASPSQMAHSSSSPISKRYLNSRA